jgi:hypothetical protein
MPSRSLLLLPTPMDLRELPLLSLYRANTSVASSTPYRDLVDDFCESLYAIFKVEEDYPVLRHCFMETVERITVPTTIRPTSLEILLDSSGLLLDSVYHLLIQHGAYAPEGILLYHYLWLDLPDTVGFATRSHDRLRRDPLLDVLETDHATRFFSITES